MFGVRHIFSKPLCCNRMPVVKTFLGNRMGLSYFLKINSNKKLSNNARHLISLPVENARFFSGNEILRFFRKQVNKLSIFHRQKDVNLGIYLYQSLEHVKFEDFYTYLDMPDTYRSWFIVSELHVWMILVRLQQEGVDARHIRDAVIESFYEDSTERAKLLAPTDGNRRNVQLKEFYENFKVALVFYDEGIISEDKILANALWYHFFAQQCNDPRHMEILIKFIRHQINFLCHLNSHDIKNYNRSHIIWQPLEPHARAVGNL